MCDSTLLLIKDKIINTDAIIKLLSDKNTQINRLKRQLKFLYKTYLAKVKELEIFNLKETTSQSNANDYKSLSEKYSELETIHQDYVNISTIKYQNICKELEESKLSKPIKTTKVIKKCNKCKDEIEKSRILKRQFTLLKRKMEKLSNTLESNLELKDEEDTTSPNNFKNSSDYKDLKEHHAAEMEKLIYEHMIEIDKLETKFKNEIGEYQDKIVSLEAQEMILRDKIDELKLELNETRISLIEKNKIEHVNNEIRGGLHDLLSECATSESPKLDCVRIKLDQSSQTDEIFYSKEISQNEDVLSLFGNDLSDNENVLSKDFLGFNNLQEFQDQTERFEEKTINLEDKIKEYQEKVKDLESNEMILKEKIDDLMLEINSIKEKSDEVEFLGFHNKQEKFEPICNNESNETLQENVINKDNLENDDNIDVWKCIQEMKDIPEPLSPFSSSENEDETSFVDDSKTKNILNKRLKLKRLAQENRRRFITNIKKDVFKSLVTYVGRMLKKSKSKENHSNINNKSKKMSKQFKNKRRLEMIRWTALREISNTDSDVSCTSKSKLNMRKLRKYKHWKVNNKEEYAEFCAKFNTMTEFYNSLSGNESKIDDNVNNTEESCWSGQDSGFGKSDNEINFMKSEVISEKPASIHHSASFKEMSSIDLFENQKLIVNVSQINDKTSKNSLKSTLSSKLKKKNELFGDNSSSEVDDESFSDRKKIVTTLEKPIDSEMSSSKEISQTDSFETQKLIINDEECLKKDNKLIKESLIVEEIEVDSQINEETSKNKLKSILSSELKNKNDDYSSSESDDESLSDSNKIVTTSENLIESETSSSKELSQTDSFENKNPEDVTISNQKLILNEFNCLEKVQVGNDLKLINETKTVEEIDFESVSKEKPEKNKPDQFQKDLIQRTSSEQKDSFNDNNTENKNNYSHKINLKNNLRFSPRIKKLKQQTKMSTKQIINNTQSTNNSKLLTNSILELISVQENPSKDISKPTLSSKLKNNALFGDYSESDTESFSDTKELVTTPENPPKLSEIQDLSKPDLKPQLSSMQLPSIINEGDVSVRSTKIRKAHGSKEEKSVKNLKRKLVESVKMVASKNKLLKKSKKVEEGFVESFKKDGVKEMIKVEAERKLEKTSFKRPVKRKMDTPMSPLHSVEYEVVPPKIIPLEPVGELCEGIGKKLLKKLIQFPDESVILQEVFEKFSSQKQQYVIRLIIEEVSIDTSKSDSKYTPPAPIMTPVQRTLLGLTIKLQETFPDILKDMLFSLEFRILTETSLNSLISITRMYTGICKLKKELHRMRRMIGDVFFTLNDLAIPFFFTVLSTWIEILPLEAESQDNMFVKVLIQIINMKKCKPGYCLTTLKGLLQNYYGYPKERWKSEDVFIEVITKFKENPSKFLEFSLLILFKNHPEKWVCEQIRTHLKPLLNDLSDNRAKKAIIVLISNTLPQFGSDNNSQYVQEIKTWLKDTNL